MVKNENDNGKEIKCVECGEVWEKIQSPKTGDFEVSQQKNGHKFRQARPTVWPTPKNPLKEYRDTLRHQALYKIAEQLREYERHLSDSVVVIQDDDHIGKHLKKVIGGGL